MMDNNSFKVINENGEEIICDILFTFDSNETGKSYIVYTDNTKDALGNVQVFASIYDPTQKNPGLQPIETESEWKIIETILTQMQSSIQNGVDNNQSMEEIIKEMEENIEDSFSQEEPREVLIRLHVYEKQQKYYLNNTAHAEYDKIGVVNMTGSCGSLTIGAHMLNDIYLEKATEISPVEVALGVINGKLFISSCSGLYETTINYRKVHDDMDHRCFYELHHGDEFILNNYYKFCVEIFDQDKVELKTCQCCKKEFISAGDEECCFDCRYEMNQELGIHKEKDLIKADILKYKNHQQKEDLDIKVLPENEEKPKIFKKLI